MADTNTNDLSPEQAEETKQIVDELTQAFQEFSDGLSKLKNQQTEVISALKKKIDAKKIEEMKEMIKKM